MLFLILLDDMKKSFFCAENLCYSYIKKALCLKDVCFCAAQNDFVLILALDDMGKTTLIKTLSGFDDKFFGRVFLEDKEIRQIPDEEKNFSIVFDKAVVLNSTIDKNLNFLFSAIKQEIPSDEEKLRYLEGFGLNFDLKIKMKKLSEFDKIKFCLLRAFIKKSRVLFIDDIFKNDFSKEQIGELISLLKMLSKDRLIFLCASDKTFKKHQETFDNLATKVLYLNRAIVREYKDVNNFLSGKPDLESIEFCDNLKQAEGYCVFQDGHYFLSVDDFVIKIDKQFEKDFEKLKLSVNENDDIILVYEQSLDVDFSRNNDINRLMSEKKLMLFSKLDGSRVI